MSEINNNYFQTPYDISKRLFENVDLNVTKKIIDLGAGLGALVEPFKDETESIEKTAIEIDANFSQNLSKLYDKVFLGDVLNNQLNNIVSSSAPSTRKLFISNPPFGKVHYSEELQNLLSDYELFPKYRKDKNCRTELVFLARTLEASAIGDQAAFIIPTSFLELSDYIQTRKCLAMNHGLRDCLTLPQNTFKNTEVRTAIIWLKPHSNETSSHIKLQNLAAGNSAKNIPVGQFIKNGITAVSFGQLDADTLEPLIVNIKRGKSSRKSLITRKIEHIHTSDLNQMHAKVIKNSKFTPSPFNSSEKIARDGDILIARVGTRVLGKASIFSGSQAVISDCVIRLRVRDDERNKIFKQLVSDKGQQWLQSAARGSCARILTYDAFQRFPISL